MQTGGTGWSPAQLFIFREECARAGAPSVLNQGANLLAPALFAYATEEQKARYLPRMLTGEHYWCQGYSEPGSGSRRARRRRLRRERYEDLDDARPLRRSHLLSRAHQHSGSTSTRHFVPAVRD